LTPAGRYIATENGKWPPVTRDRPIPPAALSCDSLCLLERPATVFSRLFEASAFLDNAHKAVHQPTLLESFNVEEVTVITRTLKSFGTIVIQSIPEQSKLFSSCLALSNTALLLSLDNRSKTISLDETTFASLDTLIDDIVEMVVVLNRDDLPAKTPTIPPFVAFLIYKAAAIVTAKLQVDIEPEANLHRFRTLRNALKVTAQRWLAGGCYLNLLDEHTSPWVLEEVKG